MAISIPPVVSQWISVGIAAAGVVALATPSVFPDYVPPGIAKDIIQTAGLMTFITGGVQTVLHRYSSSDPGPGAPQDTVSSLQKQIAVIKTANLKGDS
jgi:hypothetical protein